MTNPTIPPCPVCGTVPHCSGGKAGVASHSCNGQFVGVYTRSWRDACHSKLGRALRASGITTIAQLNERLAPDPRAAVLEAVADAVKVYLSDLRWNTQVEYENRHALMERMDALNKIAARRGEVEG